MVMRILVYGDSNSWGYLADGSGVRYVRRWPKVMAAKLGAEVLEDCVPGRTTDFDFPEMEEETGAKASDFNGLRHFSSSLLAACPADLVLIMLGTNDLHARFSVTAEIVADRLAALVDQAAVLATGAGAWRDAPPPKTCVISPVPLGPLADDPKWEDYGDWIGGRATSLALFDVLSERLGDTPILDAGRIIKASDRDPIHFEADQHHILGDAVADWIKGLVG